MLGNGFYVWEVDYDVTSAFVCGEQVYRLTGRQQVNASREYS